MSRRPNLAALIAGCCLALGGAYIETAAPAAAASRSSTSTAPQQLTNAYPLGPQRLCCTGETSAGRTAARQTATRASVAPARTRTARQTATRASAAPARTRTVAKAPGGASSGGASAVLLIGLGLASLLLVVGVATLYRTRRRPGLVLASGSWAQAPLAYSNGAATSSSATRDRASRAGPFLDGSGSPSAPASEGEEAEYRRLDEHGDADGAFNLGVVLHHRGDVAGAVAAYERAEQRGDPDAAFNLGVLLYETGDVDGAAASWRRSAAHGHVRAAANLVFMSRHRGTGYRRADEAVAGTGAFNLGVILHQQGDTAGALAAYERAEQRGDPDAAFNLGVLQYEAGDFDGAEASWRRAVEHGHTRAAANLEFLLQRRQKLENSSVTRR